MASTTAPTSQITPASLPPSVFTLAPTAQLEALYTIIRDKETSRGDFLFYSDRIIRLLVEEGLNHLPVVPKTVQTPTVRDIQPRDNIAIDWLIGGRVLLTKVSGSKAKYAVYLYCVLARSACIQTIKFHLVD